MPGCRHTDRHAAGKLWGQVYPHCQYFGGLLRESLPDEHRHVRWECLPEAVKEDQEAAYGSAEPYPIRNAGGQERSSVPSVQGFHVGFLGKRVESGGCG